MKLALLLFALAGMNPCIAQSPAGGIPDPLTTLRANYERAIERANAPIHLQYREALQRMKTEYTKAGNLEAALAVDAEIKARFTTPPPAPAGSNSLAPMSFAKVNTGNSIIAKLVPGEKLYTDSEYVWVTIPEEYAGMQFAQPKNKHAATTSFGVESDGVVYVALYSRMQDQDGDRKDDIMSRREVERMGWKAVKGKSLISNETEPEWLVFAKTCKAGETFALRTDKYCAPLILIK